MSYPIDIPAQYRPNHAADSSPYPEDGGPYMGYTEIFEKYTKLYLVPCALLTIQWSRPQPSVSWVWQIR
jgi:hypothetical protein